MEEGGGLGESKVRTSRRDEADTQEPGVGTGREGGKPAPCQVLFVRAEQQEVGALPRDLIYNMQETRFAQSLQAGRPQQSSGFQEQERHPDRPAQVMHSHGIRLDCRLCECTIGP